MNRRELPGVSWLQLRLRISQGCREGIFVCLCLSLLMDSGKSPDSPLRIVQLMFVGFFVWSVVLLRHVRARCCYPTDFG